MLHAGVWQPPCLVSPDWGAQRSPPPDPSLGPQCHLPKSPRRAARDPALSPCTPHLPHIPLLGPTPSPLPAPNTVSRHVPLLRPGPRGTRCPLPTGPFTGPNAVAPHIPSAISLHWVLIVPLCPLSEPSLRRVPAPSPLTMPPLASPHPTAPLVSGGGTVGDPAPAPCSPLLPSRHPLPPPLVPTRPVLLGAAIWGLGAAPPGSRGRAAALGRAGPFSSPLTSAAGGARRRHECGPAPLRSLLPRRPRSP